MTEKAVDIVIPVYNCPDHVKNLVKSILEQKPGSFRVYVYIVDDASGSDTREYLTSLESLDHFRVIFNPSNLGYTRSLNKGIRCGNSGLVLSINSDCILGSRTLEKLASYFDRIPELFAVSPLSNAASWQSIPRTLSDTGQMVVNKLPEGLSVDETDRFCGCYGVGLAEGSLLNGFCVMYRRKFLETLGFADETAFPRGYGEEDDLHIRAANSDLRLGVATDCFVFHAKTQSFSTGERSRLVQKGREVLNRRYGDDRIRRLASSMRDHPRIETLRTVSGHYTQAHREPVRKYLDIDWEASLQGRISNLVSVIMPVYSGADMTLNAIQSMYDTTRKDVGRNDFELTVVLNGPDPACLEKIPELARKYPFKWMITDKNLFFSMGCNLGFTHSRGEYLVFVNNDMIFNDSHWLDALVSPLKEPDTGLTGIKLLYEDQTVQSAGFLWSTDSFFPIDVYKGKDFSQLTGKQRVHGVTGACMGIRARDFAFVKGFDPLFINGSEDLDLCLKIRLFLGLNSVVDLDRTAIHLESKTPLREMKIRENRTLFYKRWAGYISGFAVDFGKRIEPADNLPTVIRMYRMRASENGNLFDFPESFR